jgi:hypothetical protein
VRSRNTLAALVALAAVVMPTMAQAQKPSPVAPSQLLAQREELDLTPTQVRELTLLATQVRRHQQAVLRAPSKPWVARTKGTSKDVASERALELLSPQQRELAMRAGSDSPQLATARQPSASRD